MTNAIKPFCRHKVKRVKKDRKMEKEKDILAGIGRRSGMTVPEGYFENFAERMKAMLPEQPEIPVEQAPAKINVWQRVRGDVRGSVADDEDVHIPVGRRQFAREQARSRQRLEQSRLPREVLRRR